MVGGSYRLVEVGIVGNNLGTDESESTWMVTDFSSDCMIRFETERFECRRVG